MEEALLHIRTSTGNAFKVQKLQLLFENQTEDGKKIDPKIRQGPKTTNQWYRVFHKVVKELIIKTSRGEV